MSEKCCICGEEPKRKLSDGHQGFFYLCPEKVCEEKLLESLQEYNDKSKK